jgi:gliding motility-associated protein GldM
MASDKETPRQKMIGMMYLVLTAMLALNVSKEVLEGYAVVNSSVVSTNKVLSSKREDTYARIKKEYRFNQVKVAPYFEKASIVRDMTGEMIQYIENMRDELIAITENLPVDSIRNISVKNLKNKDNYTVPTYFLIGNPEAGTPGKAFELKIRIAEYRKSLLGMINPEKRKNMKIGLDTEDVYISSTKLMQRWEIYYFYEIPLAAVIPILNNFITEVINAETETMEELIREIAADEYRYDQVEARVIPKTNYLFTGDEYEAEIIVAAFDTTRIPEVYLMQGVDSLTVEMKDQATLISGSHGKINFRFPATKPGIEKYAGFVSIRNNSGSVNTYHFRNEYTVASPAVSVSVSATNMNVLYVGVDNPISFAVAGISGDDIIPTISCGTLKAGAQRKNWIATVPGSCDEAKIEIAVRTEQGIKRLGYQAFRVKKVPDPTPLIIGAKSGFIPRDLLIQNGRIMANMPDDFDFEFNFRVTSFKMTLQKGFNQYSYESNSEKLTEEMKKEIKTTNKGQVVIFDEILVMDPDGESRTLMPLILTIH